MNSSFTFLLILVSIATGFVGLAFYISSQLKKMKTDAKNGETDVLMEWLKQMKSEMTGSIDKNSQVLETQLKTQRDTMDKQTKLIWERLSDATKVISGVQNELGGLQEFKSNMKDLSNVLKSPKLRGGLGEQFLYELLENSLPKDLYKTQFKFKDGNIADAVIKTATGLIAIDSKFPMENFKAMSIAETQDERDRLKKVFVRDVKARIDEISSKYILPAEGTTHFAIMYVPAENVFYELIVNTQEIEDYAKQKNVFLTSPNTLSYQVQSILVAYKQHELEKHAGEILKSLAGVKVEAEKFIDEMGVLERHIGNAYKTMDSVKTRFGKIFTRLETIQELEPPKEQAKLLE